MLIKTAGLTTGCTVLCRAAVGLKCQFSRHRGNLYFNVYSTYLQTDVGNSNNVILQRLSLEVFEQCIN